MNLAEEVEAVGALPASVVIGKVLAEIAEAGRSEKSIGDGVAHDVAVAVPCQAGGAFDHHATEDEAAARIGAEAMDVEPLAHPDHRSIMAWAWTRSSPTVILRLASSPGTATTRPPAASTR